MKLLLLNFFLPFVISSRLTASNKRLFCKDCKYFIANKSECALFSEQSLVTGKETYKSAFNVRNDECGKDAQYFETNKYKLFTNTYYFINDYLYMYLFIFAFNYTSLWFAVNLFINIITKN
jgi:hypothetical protein